MQNMAVTIAATFNQATRHLYLFPNGIRDFDETDAADTKAYAGNNVFLGAGLVTGISLSSGLAVADGLAVHVYDAINEVTQQPQVGGNGVVARYRIDCAVAPVGTKGDTANPGPIFDPYVFGANGSNAIANLANSRLLASQVFETGGAGESLLDQLRNIECPHGIVVVVENISAATNYAFVAASPLKVNVNFVRWGTGALRRKHAPRNAATHASKVGRSLSHAPLSI